ncbi:MAG: hypothetical protein ACYTFW_20225 [Planctomycetota bacterium]|jgi:hypothetical protein
MKLSLNKEIATKAYLCHYARCSTTNRIIICVVDSLVLVACVILDFIEGFWLEPVDPVVISICFLMIWDLDRQVFRDAHWKRGIKKLFESTDKIDVEIQWSDSQI